MIGVLIVAAYASVRAGLHALLAETEGITVLGAVSGSAELERLLAGNPPDVVLFDEHEDEADCVIATLAGSEAGLVMLGESRCGFRKLAGSSLPGWAFLLKEADGAEIAEAIRGVAAGLVVLDRSLAPLLALPASQTSSFAAANAAGIEEALTPREREVLQLVADGLQNKQIATRLRISQHTVKFHVASILLKLGAASRTEAVTLGARRGYVML